MEDNKTKKYSDNYLNSLDNYNKAFNYLQTSKQIIDEIERIIKTYNDYTKDYQKKLSLLKANIAKTFYVDDCVKLKNDSDNYKSINIIIKIFTDIITLQIKRISEFFPENIQLKSTDNPLITLKKNKPSLELEKKKMDKNFIDFDTGYRKLLTLYKESEETIRNFYLEQRKNKEKNEDILNETITNLRNNTNKFKTINTNFEKNNSNFFELYDKCMKDINDELNNYNISLLYNIINLFDSCSKYHNELSKYISSNLENSILKKNLEITLDYNEFQKNNFSKIEKTYIKEKYNVKAAKERFIETKIERKTKDIITDLYEMYGYDDELKEEHIIINEEDVYNINKIFHEFEFVDKTDYDLEIEKKKLLVINLTNKILFFKLKNESKDEYPGLTEIDEKQLNNLYEMIKEKPYRHAFLKRLNNYRAFGYFEMPEKEFNIILKCFMISIDNIINENDNDLDSAKLTLILSQTFYMIENNKKKYLYNKISGHKIFQEKKLWVEYLNNDLKIEEEKINKGVKNNNNDKNEEEKAELTDVGAFSQVVSFSSNMIDFGMSEEILKEIITPVIEKYKIDGELLKTLNDVIKQNLQKHRNK